MDKANLNLFDGAVSHRRVGNKKHQFEYKYKSAFIEDVFDFHSGQFISIHSKILSFDDNYSDMSGKVIDSMRSFMQDKNIEANQCKVNLLRTPNIGFIKSFNPVCFWFLEIKKECKLFVAEVKNTFYEDQIYIVENNGKAISENTWLEVEKNMYVSPFAEKSGFYKFNLSRNPFKIKINQFNKEKKAEIVTNIRGAIVKVKGINKLIFYFSLALSSILVLVRIHIQALFLWMKKFKIFPHGDSGYAD
tara:strand:- start:1608 stop:2348 length:741 start_codon:yes stop_codon:yes gene_type:complete